MGRLRKDQRSWKGPTPKPLPWRGRGAKLIDFDPR
jgi:hypothetical protein